jgi:hypothetical protein
MRDPRLQTLPSDMSYLTDPQTELGLNPGNDAICL